MKSAQLKSSLGRRTVVLGDRVSLKHAMAEILLNALQANPDESAHRRGDEIRRGPARATRCSWSSDNGTGFSPEAARRVPEPFFTTRNVGLGLGLVVSRKVVETHRGRFEVVPPQSGRPGSCASPLPWPRRFPPSEVPAPTRSRTPPAFVQTRLKTCSTNSRCWVRLIRVLRLLVGKEEVQGHLVALVHDRPVARNHAADMEMLHAGDGLR